MLRIFKVMNRKYFLKNNEIALENYKNMYKILSWPWLYEILFVILETGKLLRRCFSHLNLTLFKGNLTRRDPRNRNDKKIEFSDFNWFHVLLFKLSKFGFAFLWRWKVFSGFVSLLSLGSFTEWYAFLGLEIIIY